MSVSQILDTMEYGPAPESAAEALAWLVDKGSVFGQFIDGAWTEPRHDFEAKNPASGEVLAHLTQARPDEVEAAVAAARKAQPKWARLGGAKRARLLYALARAVQRNARLFAVLETLDNGKPIRESRDIDIPLVARHFYYHAGMAQLMEEALPERAALGVCGQIIPWNFPLLMLAWKVAPALAMGNTVVLKPAEWTSLTALLFADLCREVGLPKGVLNIVTGDGAVGEMIAGAEVDKIAFTGSTEVGRKIREATAGSGKALTLELGGKSPYIVFEDADLDSAIEGLVDAIWFNQGQVCCAGSRLLVQEGIAEGFYAKLRRRMDGLRVGDPLDKCIDIGAVVDPVQLQRIREMVAGCGGVVHQGGAPDMSSSSEAVGREISSSSEAVGREISSSSEAVGREISSSSEAVGHKNGCYFPPTLITGLSPADPLMQEEIFGPVLVATTFRTPAEAVQLANNTRYGLAASVWSENVNLALDVAPKLAAGVVWVNGTNMFDAAAGFGGVRESGFGREGGWEGLRAYTKPKAKRRALERIVPATGAGEVAGMDRTAKLYIGGKQARPDGGYSRMVYGPKGKALGQVGLANRKDLRNAVEAAQKATGWAKATAHNRAQVLYYVAENLSAREAEFAGRIRDMTGASAAKAKAEVAASIDRLFTFAAWADKLDGAAKPVPMRGVALAMNEPVGVIGILCPDEAPLLGFVSCVAPAIAMGNRVVAVASEPYPLAATDLYQVLETSDLPGGVVNILTGSHTELAPHLAGHMDVEAVWSFSSSDLSAVVERESASNLKRTWVNNALSWDWGRAAAEPFLAASTEVKTVWVPYGE